MFDSLRMRTPEIIGWEDYRKSAVLIPIIETDKGREVLFQVRAKTLRNQPGEICFPGGRIEAGEDSRSAAIRETMEELLVKRDQIDIICPLDIFVSPFAAVITPYLGQLSRYKGTFNADEVDHVFSVPLDFFQEHPPKMYMNKVYNKPGADFPYDKIPYGEQYPWNIGRYEICFYEYEGNVIWGMTARILKSFIDILKKIG